MSRIKISALIALSLLLSIAGKSNNIEVSNVQLTGQDVTNHFTMVQFDISWENSWRYAGGPANWDAAWVFVKYRVGSNGEWKHALLSNTGHTVCTGTTLRNGLLSPDLVYDSGTNPVLGVFLYRSAAGAGTFSCENVRLRWNYGDNTVTDGAQVDVRVFAIEMVYVPQGSFNVGSGGTEQNAFYTYPNSNTPFNITSEAAIPVGAVSGNLYYPNTQDFPGDQLGPIPAAFPKGHKAFYAMKYEISEQSYADFLNTLTRAQQASRVTTNISGTSTSDIWVMSGTNTPFFRSYVKCRFNLPEVPDPVQFSVDLNNNNMPDVGDGNNIACGYLSFFDLAAYLDWSALRLMTEFEFEKCARGMEVPVPNEYAWGNVTFTVLSGYLYTNTPQETPNDTFSNAVSFINGGAVRVGAFARTNGSRVTSGAGYYGCMELSTNLYERCVSVGSPQGRAYTGSHGNGSLDASGYHNVSGWPDNSTAVGSSIRGGSALVVQDSRTSNRRLGAYVDLGRQWDYGGRGVRTE